MRKRKGKSKSQACGVRACRPPRLGWVQTTKWKQAQTSNMSKRRSRHVCTILIPALMPNDCRCELIAVLCPHNYFWVTTTYVFVTFQLVYLNQEALEGGGEKSPASRKRDVQRPGVAPSNRKAKGRGSAESASLRDTGLAEVKLPCASLNAQVCACTPLVAVSETARGMPTGTCC